MFTKEGKNVHRIKSPKIVKSRWQELVDRFGGWVIHSGKPISLREVKA